MRLKAVKKTAVALAVGLAAAYAFAASRIDGQALTAVPRVDLYRILCDAFVIPGLILLALGFLMLVSGQGALDGVGWLAKNALRFLIPAGGLRMEGYKEYLEHRRANRTKGYGFLFLAAGILLGAAAVFLVLFYSVWQK